MEKFESVAVLVDGDNIRASYAEQILSKIDHLGPSLVRRAYCRAECLADWASAPHFLKVHTGSKENGTDIHLSIEAMKFALQDSIQAFAIVSHDRDFSHIAHALREMGRHVVGLATNQVGKDFERACSEFVQLKKPSAKVATEQLGEVDQALRKIFEEKDPDGLGLFLKDINPLTRRRIPDFKISEQDEMNWPNYFKQRSSLYTIKGNGPDRRVTITRQAN